MLIFALCEGHEHYSDYIYDYDYAGNIETCHSSADYTDSTSMSFKETKTIGIIGLGDMGLMYARRFSEAGWK